MIKYDEYEGVYFWIPNCQDKGMNGHLMKIGRSKDVLKRSQSLQTGCPYPLLQMWRLWVPGVDIVQLERQIHDDYARFHIHHEWFAIPTLEWIVTRDTMHAYFQFADWECLINNGDVGRWYIRERLKPESVDWVVSEVTQKILGKRERRVGA